jgi:hypothetical protein
VVGPDWNKPDARPDTVRSAATGEAVLADRFANALYNPNCLRWTTVLQQDSELIPSQPRHGVTSPHLPPQQLAQLLQQLVSGLVTTRVINALESVQVQEPDGVGRPLLRRARDRLAETTLEDGSVHEAR